MNDFLGALVARQLGLSAAIRPRVAGWFEPPPARFAEADPSFLEQEILSERAPPADPPAPPAPKPPRDVDSPRAFSLRSSAPAPPATPDDPLRSEARREPTQDSGAPQPQRREVSESRMTTPVQADRESAPVDHRPDLARGHVDPPIDRPSTGRLLQEEAAPLLEAGPVPSTDRVPPIRWEELALDVDRAGTKTPAPPTPTGTGAIRSPEERPHLRRLRPAASLNEPAAAPTLSAPTIHITIGRIEVRAAPPVPPASGAPATPRPSLQDYLRARQEGER